MEYTYTSYHLTLEELENKLNELQPVDYKILEYNKYQVATVMFKLDDKSIKIMKRETDMEILRIKIEREKQEIIRIECAMDKAEDNSSYYEYLSERKANCEEELNKLKDKLARLKEDNDDTRKKANRKKEV
jgi:multidrug resistance efflux pump